MRPRRGAQNREDEKMIAKDFVTGGRAVFTIECPGAWMHQRGACAHYTYRVSRKEAEPGSQWGDTYFVSLLTGPQNESDYTYLGILDAESGAVRLTRASRMGDDCLAVTLLRRVLARLWAGEADAITAAGFDVHHEGRCCRCGRTLTTPDSIAAGIGPECRSRRGAEAGGLMATA